MCVDSLWCSKVGWGWPQDHWTDEQLFLQCPVTGHGWLGPGCCLCLAVAMDDNTLLPLASALNARIPRDAHVFLDNRGTRLFLFPDTKKTDVSGCTAPLDTIHGYPILECCSCVHVPSVGPIYWMNMLPTL